MTCESYTDEGIVTAKGGPAGLFPEAMEILLRMSEADIDVSTGLRSTPEIPDVEADNSTRDSYGWSIKEKFATPGYTTSTGMHGRVAMTAGPGEIGGEGQVHVRRTLGVKMRIDPKEGASSTKKSLRIDGGTFEFLYLFFIPISIYFTTIYYYLNIFIFTELLLRN